MNTPTTIALFLLIEMIAPAHASELGRLFFSPSERSQLEQQESRTLASENNDTAITVNGIIKRRDGSRIVWINGKMQEADPGKDPDSVTVPIPGKSGAIEVMVGQRIVLDKGTSTSTRNEPAP